jgi:hypothetical protein
VHQPPCEPLESAKLEFAREITALKKKGPNLAIWIPVITTILGAIGAIASAWVSDAVTTKAASVASVTAQQTCQALIISQSATYMMGVQTGKTEEQKAEAGRKQQNPPPLGLVVKNGSH